MAERGLTIELDERLAERIKNAAADAGVSVNEFVGQTLEAWLEDWSEDLRRLDEPGESINAELALMRFEKRIAALLAERK